MVVLFVLRNSKNTYKNLINSIATEFKNQVNDSHFAEAKISQLILIIIDQTLSFALNI